MSGPMLQMLNGFTILRAVNMGGGMGLKVSKEELLALNSKLNRVKRK